VKTAIWWLRRDLRLTDNQALASALEQSEAVIPVFVLDDNLLSKAPPNRVTFLLEGLRQLDQQLRKRQSRLIIRAGDPVLMIESLLTETGAHMVLAEPDYSSYALKRDRQADRQLPMQWVGSPAVHVPGSVVKPNGEPYTVFTPFSKAWKALPSSIMSAWMPPDTIHTPLETFSLDLPEGKPVQIAWPFPPGEEEGLSRLSRFTQGHSPRIFQYGLSRNLLDSNGTSQLSPYLRFGMLSARQAVKASMYAIQSAPDENARRSAEAWLNELIWRDFYIHILYHFPGVSRSDFRPLGFQWENNPSHFNAWCKGLTGVPVVDAAMRQLLQTGWMHNRARMIVASFLTKDLLIDWRWGERWFMQHLIDGDPAANNGGWQWIAGTGTDAAPFFRIFNPVTQGLKFDPSGSFIRRWLPELDCVPVEYIHQPNLMPAGLQDQVGCRIGKHYPAPLVDHAFARQRAMEHYRKART
jgi:deoxyribodipyrimidine photo-lyase